MAVRFRGERTHFRSLKQLKMCEQSGFTFSYTPLTHGSQRHWCVFNIPMQSSSIFFFYSCGSLKIFQTELCWSCVQSKIQIIRGLTGLFPRIQPRPFLNSLSGSPTFIPSAFKRGGGGRMEMTVPVGGGP